jgi:hypothetical protein
MPLNDAWIWLEQTALAAAVREGPWLYPAIETVHILALAILFGSIALLDIRLLGASQSIPLGVLAKHALSAAYGAFAALVATGSLMFMADASELAVNRAFQIKILLIAAAALNALVFNLGTFRRLRAESDASQVPRIAKAFAAASLCLWTAVVVFGRLIAYV